MNKLLITFYGDDFTGSTDALEQLALAGIRTALFIEPPTASQLKRFPKLQAIGVAGMTRSMSPQAMECKLRPALKKLKALGAPHVHYKVCSTFDSSPKIGSVGRAIDVAAEIFGAPFVPLLVAAPALGRFTVFGTHFARYGIGSSGTIHRLDRLPCVSKHPITPMLEADLRRHLEKQTKKVIGLFDILKLTLPIKEAKLALNQIVDDGADVVLFDALYAEHMHRIGELIDDHASAKKPLFSVGSSGIEMALGALWRNRTLAGDNGKSLNLKAQNLRLVTPSPTKQLLVASGSCSPVTEGQIKWALKQGFAEVELDATALVSEGWSGREFRRATDAVGRILKAGRSVIAHTGQRRTVRGSTTAKYFGSALGKVVRGALAETNVRRVCITGGDTSSYAARALGIEALEMIALLTPGAPLCKAHAPDSPADGREVVFKGGQVGAEDYFGVVKNGDGTE